MHRYDPSTGEDTAQSVPDVVSLALPRRRGGVVIGLPDGLHLLDGERSPLIAAIESERADTRTNDGACDAAGRLWVGTMALDERSPVAALYRVDSHLGVTTVLTGTTISNGLGWSPTGATSTSSTAPPAASTCSTAIRRPAPSTTGSPSPPSRSRAPSPTASPSTPRAASGWRFTAAGACTATRRTADLRRSSTSRSPAVTSCCFGGDDLRDLYVTTRREGLSASELAAQPLAGALLRLDAGVAGLPTHAFAG